MLSHAVYSTYLRTSTSTFVIGCLASNKKIEEGSEASELLARGNGDKRGEGVSFFSTVISTHVNIEGVELNV